MMVEVTADAVAEMCAQLGGFSGQSVCPDQSPFYNEIAGSDILPAVPLVVPLVFGAQEMVTLAVLAWGG